MNELESLRLRARLLLNLSEPGDALYAYYALYHAPQRTQLYVHDNKAGHPDGFVAVCQTGRRLFQPTVAMRTPDANVAAELLHQALVSNRPYHLITTPDLQQSVTEVLEIERSEINHVYKLDLLRFGSSINVLVVTEEGLGGLPRFVIRSQGEVAAEAGVNWASTHFAEIFTRTEQAAEGRGWGQAVLTSCTTWAIRSARQPLYVVNRTEEANIAMAEAIGYVDTGAREFNCEGVCRL